MQSPSTSDTPDPSASFLTGLGNRDFEPLLAHATGTLGIDLTEPSRSEHWHVDVDRGKVKVSHEQGGESATVSMSHDLFNSAVSGQANLWTAMLRGSMEVEGDLHLVVLFQRLLPGPQAGTQSSAGIASR